MRILYVSNDDGGFASYIEVAPGTTIGALVAEKFPDRAPSSLSIRVNREAKPVDYVIQEGDRVNVTPAKIAGAEPVSWAGPALAA